jgi:splicing factor 3A subunit 1
MVITGVIRPPEEIRAVADRTALYVAKNGRAFESRILSSAKGQTPKFAFLQSSSPFHAYYQNKIAFYEANGGKEEEDDEKDEEKKGDKEPTEKSKGKNNNVRVAVKKKAAVSAAIDPVAKALLTQRQKIAQIRAAATAARKRAAAATTSSEAIKNDEDGGTVEMAAAEIEEEATAPVVTTTLEPPPALHFINIVAPATLSVAQIETIQLVAQLTALDGKGGAFLQQLSFREWNNPTYAFCHPRSGHFAYFSALVDAYRRVLTFWTASTTTNRSDNGSSTILAAASKMVNNRDKDDKVDEMANNVPKCLELAAYQVEYKRDLALQRRLQQQDAADADVIPLAAAALIDWHDFVIVETIDFPADQQVVMLPPPPPPLVQETATGKTIGGAVIDMNDSDDDEYDGDDDAGTMEEQIRVVPTYTPKVVSAAAAAQRAKEQMTMIDPISGKSVAIKDMPEHLRIQLLDPKWAQERKKFQDKQKETNLVSADTFADNVAKFAQARGMASNSRDQELLNGESSSDASRMRLEDANRILRQQALDPRTSVGPSLPGAAGRGPPSFHHHAAPAIDSSMQPDLKRPRLDTLQLPPPVHHSSAATVPPPPPPPPPSVSASASKAAPPVYPTTYVLAPPGFEAGLPPPPPPSGEDPFVAAATMATADADGDDNAAPGDTEGELLSEADFVASLPKPLVTLQIRIPNDQSQMAWNFYGQIVALESINVMSTVKAVKQELSRTHLNGMPANKIQLKLSSNNTFLKDSLTLAALNLGGPTSTTTLELVPKTRGGRK